MDNYYNSYNLTCELLKNGIYSCGTLRKFRGGPEVEKIFKTRLKKNELAVFSKNKTNIIYWMDKRLVLFISSIHKFNDIKNLSQKRSIIYNDDFNFDVFHVKERPDHICDYNKKMGGIDKHDQLSQYYPLIRRTKRWTLKFSLFLIQTMICNAYILFLKINKKNKKISHLKFQEKIMNYLFNNEKIKENIQLSKINQTKSDSIKFFHMPEKSTKRNQCKNCFKNKKKSLTYYKCKKCQVYMCIDNCYEEWHVVIQEKEHSTILSSDSCEDDD